MEKKIILIGAILIVLLVGVGAIAYIKIPIIKETLQGIDSVLPIVSSSMMDPENYGTLAVVEGKSSWQNIKAIGDESDLTFWTTNKDDKKAEIGWIPNSGSCAGQVDKNLYHENNSAIVDDQDKEITLKCESSKCSGQNCYHLSLTEAQAINIDTYVKLGETSSIIVYQNESRLNYQLDFASINITLLKNVSGIFQTQINDIFVNYVDETYKFGANDSSNNGTEMYKYVLESGVPIYNKGNRYYVRNPIPIESGGIMKYNYYEAHYFDFGDICSRNFSNGVEANCSYNSYELNGKYYLETTFFSDKDIDPTIILDDADVYTNAILSNVSIQANFSYLNISNASIMGYYSFDGQTTYDTAIDLSGFGNDCPVLAGGNPVNETGQYGQSVNFSGGFINAYECPSGVFGIAGGTEYAISFWINPSDTDTIYGIFGHQYRRPVKIELTTGGAISVSYRTLSSIGTFSSSGGSIPLDTWTHVTTTYIDGVGGFIYINGVEDGTSSAQGVLRSNLASNRIGGEGQINYGLNARLDDFMIMNSLLTSTEVTSVFNAQYDRFFPRGEQTINSIDVSDTGTEDTLNVTLQNCQANILTENLSVSIGAESGGSYTYGSEVAFVNCVASDIDITTPENISVKLVFNSEDRFLSPYINGEVTLDSWVIGVGDENIPQITNIRDNNGTLIESGIVTINATITSTNGTAKVTFNGTDFPMGNTGGDEFNVSFQFDGFGDYNYTISALGNGTSNLLNSTELIPYNIVEIIDLEFPLFSGETQNPVNDTEFNLGLLYGFNATITHTNGTAGIEFDGVNFSLSNIGDLFNFTTTNLNSQLHTYYFWAYGNGTLENFNNTELSSYTVAQNTSWALGLTGTTPIDYLTPGDFDFDGCPSQITCELFRNDTSGAISNPDTTVLAAGSYNYTANSSGNANYSIMSNTSVLVVNKISPPGSLINNKADTFVYDGLTATISISESNTGDSDVVYEIIVDNVSEGITYNQAGAGFYEIVLNTTGGQNYSINPSMDDFNLSIIQQTTNLGLTGTTPIDVGTVADVLGSGCPSQITCNLSRNDTGNVDNPDTTVLGVGEYLYTFNTTGNQNYTGDSETFNLVVNQLTQTAILTFNETSPIIHLTNLNVTCNGNLLRDDVDVNATENGLSIILGVETYAYSCQLPETDDLSYDDDNATFIVNQAPGIINLTINGTEFNLTIEQSEALDLNATLLAGEKDIEILLDNVQIVSGASPIFINNNFTVAGIFNISAHVVSSQNFTEAYDTLFVNVTTSGSPEVNIVFPIDGFNTTDTGLEINYTVDVSGQTCWWTNDSGVINNTIDCGTNITGQTWADNTFVVTVYSNNSVNNIGSDSVEFMIDTADPFFINLNNRSTEVNQSFIYNVQAEDEGVGVQCFEVNDTINFKIDCDGLLENNTAFDSIDIINIELFVNDSLAHSVSQNISIIIDQTGEFVFNVFLPRLGNVSPDRFTIPLFGVDLSFAQIDSGVLFDNPDKVYSFDTTGGGVGIGTETPGAFLDVAGNVIIDSGTTIQTILTLGHFLTTNSHTFFNILAGTNRGASVTLQSGSNADRLWAIETTSNAGDGGLSFTRADGVEKIGIGTLEPVAELHISSNTNANIVLEDANGPTDEKKLLMRNEGDSFRLAFQNDAGAGSAYWFKLIRDSVNKNRLGALSLGVDATPSFYVDVTNKRVGIGTTNPTVALNVTGDVGITGDIIVDDITGDDLNFNDLTITNAATINGKPIGADGTVNIGIVSWCEDSGGDTLDTGTKCCSTIDRTCVRAVNLVGGGIDTCSQDQTTDSFIALCR